VSGINLDEEMANMVAFQHGYNASARFVTTFDEMIETIIQMGA
jgi:flagellar hook-associated protein 1 FlgK